METNKKPLSKVLSWNTKFFVLLALTLVVVSYFYNDLEYSLAVGSFVALLVVLIVEYSQILSVRHPKTWRAVKFFVIMMVILLTLISTVLLT